MSCIDPLIPQGWRALLALCPKDSLSGRGLRALEGGDAAPARVVGGGAAPGVLPGVRAGRRPSNFHRQSEKFIVGFPNHFKYQMYFYKIVERRLNHAIYKD